MASSNAIQEGMAQARRNLVGACRRSRQIAGAASPDRIDAGQNVAKNKSVKKPGGAPCDSWLLTTLLSMSSPMESTKKPLPARAKIAQNHGSTSTANQIRPAAGRRSENQRAERSATIKVAAVKPTIMRMSGPL